MSAVEPTTTGELVKAFSPDQLSSIASFDDAVRLSQMTFGEVDAATDLGDGFELLKDKDPLVGVEFIIVDRQFRFSTVEGDLANAAPREYVTVKLVTRRGKFRISDGSTGIFRQLADHRDKPFRPMLCPTGLTVSKDYIVRDESGVARTDDQGRVLKGTTYYISTEAPKA